MRECDYCQHCEMCRWREELEERGCDFFDDCNKWIPVSERLPKAGEYIGDVAKYYLVQNEYGDMMVARYTHSEYWEQIYQLRTIGDEIVAWMPLPKPYEPQERSRKNEI